MARTLPCDEHHEEYEEWFLKNHHACQSELACGTLGPELARLVEQGFPNEKSVFFTAPRPHPSGSP